MAPSKHREKRLHASRCFFGADNILFSHIHSLARAGVYARGVKNKPDNTRGGKGLHNGRRPFIHMNDSFSAVAFHPPPLILPAAATCTHAERKGRKRVAAARGDAAPPRTQIAAGYAYTPLSALNPGANATLEFFFL